VENAARENAAAGKLGTCPSATPPSSSAEIPQLRTHVKRQMKPQQDSQECLRLHWMAIPCPQSGPHPVLVFRDEHRKMSAHAPRLLKFIVAQSDGGPAGKAEQTEVWRAYGAKLIEVYGFPPVGQWAESPF